MIPKIVHYIWFGGKPYPPTIQKCIESWHKYLPEYEFKLWNEETFDLENACKFVKEAYHHKKWAFVADYVRVWALNKYGGLYLDTDVEVKKPFDDVLSHKLLLGTDELGHLTAMMGSEANLPIWRNLLDTYHNMSFALPDGSFNTKVNNAYIESELMKEGYRIANEKQVLSGGETVIYPDDWFHAADHMTGILHITPDTHAIHWHTLTWCDTSTHVNRFIRVKLLGKIIGGKRANAIFNALHNLLKK